MSKSQPKNFALIESILVVIILGMIGFTGWYVWHAKQVTDETLSAASKSSQATIPAKKLASANTFAECKATSGSKTLLTYPEQCVTKDGKTFTDPNAKPVAPSTATDTYQKTILSKTESGLQAAVKAKAGNCTNSSGQYVSEAGEVIDPITYYIAGRAANVLICSARYQFALSSGAWTYVSSGQSAPNCEVLKKYNYPSTLLGADAKAECFDTATNKYITYTSS